MSMNSRVSRFGRGEMSPVGQALARSGWQPGPRPGEWRYGESRDGKSQYGDRAISAVVSQLRTGWQRVRVAGVHAGEHELVGPFKWSHSKDEGAELVADVPLEILGRGVPTTVALAEDFQLADLGIGSTDERARQLDRWAALLAQVVRSPLRKAAVDGTDPSPDAEQSAQGAELPPHHAEQAVTLLRGRGWDASRLGSEVRIALADVTGFEQVKMELGGAGLRFVLPLAEFEECSESSFAAALLVAAAADQQLPLARVVRRVDGARSLVAEVDLGGLAHRNHVTTQDCGVVDGGGIDSPWTDAALTSLTECAQSFAEEVRALRDEALAVCVLEGAARRVDSA